MNNLNKIICAAIAVSILTVGFSGCGQKDRTPKDTTPRELTDYSTADTPDTHSQTSAASSSSSSSNSSKPASSSAAQSDTENSSASSSNTQSAASSTQPASSEIITVTAANTEMYSGENGTGSIIKYLNSGEEVSVLEKTPGDFWKIQTADGTIGYVKVTSLGRTYTTETIIENGGDNNPSTTPTNTTTNTTVVPSSSSQSETPQPPSDTGAPSSAPTENQNTNQDFNSLVTAAQNSAGGNWAAALVELDTDEMTSYNSTTMQAASLIKLYIMGAVYENYDTYASQNANIDNLLYSMITVSDNTAANTLVGILGSGNTDAGKNAVTNYCQRNGYYNSSMGRLLLESTMYGDNYTSAGDCAQFLTAVYNGSLPHSGEMLNLLKQQQRTSKIPAGVPYGVQTANKTGELDLVQNDAAIVFAEKPYVLCVMSENVGAGSGVSAIVNLSRETYNLTNG